MMPPTISTCREVSDHTAGTVVAASAGRVIATVLPKVVMVDGEPFLETYLGGEHDEHRVLSR